MRDPNEPIDKMFRVKDYLPPAGKLVVPEKTMKPEKEFKYYLDNQSALVKKYNGKFIVIKAGAVIGSYGSELEAVRETSKKYELGTFLVQKCEPGKESYSQTFHSRVTFA